jgi:serpin B
VIDAVVDWHPFGMNRYSQVVMSTVSGLALGLLGGCSTPDSGSEDGETDPSAEPTWPMLESDVERELDPQLDAGETGSIAADQRALALDLYHVLRSNDFAGEGFAVSSYSVAAAFGMLYGGTVGEAREQMQATLHYSLGDERQHVAHNWLDRQLASRNLEGFESEFETVDPVILETANGVWIARGFDEGVNPTYLDLLARHYGAGVHVADFAGDPKAETDAINRWVSIRTRELIPELFRPGVISTETNMVLVNALYLKAPWAEVFSEHATSKAPFTKLDGASVEVDMMYQHALSGSYGADEGYAALAIPLRGDDLEVVFVVPDDFTAFEAALDQPSLDAVLDGLEPAYVSAYIPRFELETDAELTKLLREDLGMPAPFLDDSSFDDIVPGLGVITHVIHKTVIKVDEKGTEAAAATGIVVGEGGGEDPEPIASFRADKPFLLMIRDRPTHSVLFFGRVLEP